MLKNINQTIIDEAMSDDSASDSVKSAQIRALHKENPEFTERVLIAITGWGMETLEKITTNRTD
jgi:hypothetical protein|tara:strand:+ start:1550 stop:1741 length:192 start_codon:yes stop_codon:yes gene_type:complete